MDQSDYAARGGMARRENPSRRREQIVSDDRISEHEVRLLLVFKHDRDCWLTYGELTTYQRVAEPLLRRLAANVEASRTLAAIRYALLPNLLSGEVQPT